MIPGLPRDHNPGSIKYRPGMSVGQTKFPGTGLFDFVGSRKRAAGANLLRELNL
ncbi:hypothetical protein FRUB_02150 [Fimbriiglobus ruber]|uniref:Uncharacterized protein n=1 Tax=Fimbriiglobus ruber TaxID=1908690 RepID=A0A225E8L3_9BACT|nr:hypothetical protein FRUB_02150 [Fimbriiglobus ruber]